ncbi:Ig-like domain-containing protein [Paenibacillus taichungensis]|uniref:Ig-like domain-containing protein n=1 Tax=Paenibacillus taichungensis TaxID=484184 RepID=UPI002871A8D9|nr:S-layer homology domain-containing protein [Paenibacillus taichungensis]MDR9743762.1 S-layer homology domain-containing protein [Paenibacillus taichungensis]
MRKMKRTAQLAMIALLLSNTVPVAAQSQDSADQKITPSSISSGPNATNQLNDSMNKAVGMGFIKGDPDGNLRATDPITRQELAVVLAQALGLTTSKKVSEPFVDVNSASWSAPSIQAVKKAGLLQGDAKGYFHPRAEITGQELITVLVRATAYATQGNQIKSLPSEWKGASAWAAPYIQAAEKANLLSEYQGENKVKQGLVRGEAIGMMLSAIFPETRLSVVQSIHGSQAQINGVVYQISEQVAGLLNERNKAVLDQAGIQFKSQDHTITEINALEIRKGGKSAQTGEAEFSRNLLLNAEETTLNGDLTIKADFTSVQGLKIKGKLTIAPEMEHDFYAKNIKVEQSISVQGGDSNTVVFEDSVLNNVNIDKSDVHVVFSGSTNAQEVSIESDSTLEIANTAELSLLNIVDGASKVELQGTVDKVKLNTSQPLQLKGNVSLQQLTVDGVGAVNLNVAGTIQQLQVNNAAAQVSITGNIKVAEVSLAAGVPSSAVSGNTGTVTSNATSSSSGGTGGSETTPVVANRSPELLKPFENRKFTANGQGKTLNLNDYVTDPDGDSITYTVASSKSSVAKVVLSGSNLEIIPLEHGTATITVSSNDGRGKRLRSTFDVNVNAPPLPSPIPDQELVAGSDSTDVHLMVYVMDDEKYESELLYSVLNSALEIVDTEIVKSEYGQSVLRLTPKKAGEVVLKIKVDDGQIADDGSTGVTELDMRVVVLPPLNRAPMGEAPSKIDVYLGDDIPVVKLNELYTDPDGDALMYSAASSNSDGVTVEENAGELKLTALQLGTYTISYSVNDGKGGVTSGTFDINVDPIPNLNPVGQSPSSINVYLGFLPDRIPSVNLNDYYSDPDGDPLTFSASSSDPDGLIVEEVSGVLNLTALKFGEYTIRFSVDDGRGGFVSNAFQIRVNPKPNASPVLTSDLSAQTLFLGKEDIVIDLSQYFSDPDGDVLEFQTPIDFNNFLIAEMNIQENKLIIHPKRVGQFQANIIAKDVYGKEATASIDVEVLESGSIGSIPDQTIMWPWSTLDIDLTPYLLNFDISTLTVDASSGDVNIAEVSTAGPKVSVAPVAEGQTTVTLSVYDQSGRREQVSFGMTIQGEPPGPNISPEVVSSIYEQVLTPTVTNDRTFDLSQLFSDPDGDSLQFAISSSSSEAVNASINGSLLTLKPGTGNAVAPITLTAKDGKGGEAEYSFNVRTASLVNAGVMQINTKSGVQDALTYSTSNLFPGQTSFKLYSGTPDSTFTGPDTINTTQITLTASPLYFWIIGNDGRAVVVQVNSLPQGSPELFFSQYMDAGDGRSVVQLYYTGDGNPSHKATGYQVDVYQWMKKTSTMKVTTKNVFDVVPGMPFIYINYIFYDFFDITSATYYNDELELYNPNEYNVVALVLKKDGRIVDVLGDPSSHDQFMPAGGTFIRKRGIYTGSQQFSLTGEWNEFPKGTLQYVGKHTP